MVSVLVCAVDIGTSSCRAMVVDSHGRVLSRAKETYPTYRPHPTFEEQDPDEVRAAVCRTIRECITDAGEDAQRVRALSFSSQMYSLIALDAHRHPITNNILWSDGRAGSQARAMVDECTTGTLYSVTGCPPSSIYPAAKIRWLRENDPSLFAAAERFVSIKEYVLQLFIDEVRVDWSMASSTGLLDITKRMWNAEALRLAGITPDRLSQPVDGAVAITATHRGVLGDLGLPPETKIVLGGGDGPLANVGAGAGDVGAVNIDLGTSGAVRVVTDRPATDDQGALWCYCLNENRWVYGGILSNVGNALAWVAGLSDNHPSSTSPAELLEAIDDLPDEPDPLTFLPYLRPARSPHWNDTLPGALIGLRPRHDRRHIARALIEAVAFDLLSVLHVIDRTVPNRSPIILSGGLSQSSVVAQTMATVLDRPLLTRPNPEASLLGAAIVGFVALGILPGTEFTPPEPRETPDGEGGSPPGHGLYRPRADLVERYSQRYQDHLAAVARMDRYLPSTEGAP